MSAVLLVLAEVVVVYLINFNGSYFAAVSYKDSFPLDKEAPTLNGFFLRIFVAVSKIGDLLYHAVRFIGNLCAELISKRINNEKLRAVLNEVIDICLYFIILIALNRFHESFAYLGDLDFPDNLWGKFLESNTYTTLLYDIMTSRSRHKLRDFIGMLLIFVVEQFLYYTIIFGFLDARMRQTGVSKFISSRKFKDDGSVGDKVQERSVIGAGRSFKEGLEGESTTNIVVDGLKSIVTTVRDGVSHALWLFIGFYRVSVAIVTVCVLAVVVVILRAAGVLEFTASSMLSEIISWDDITSIIFNVIFTVLIVKFVQVIVVQTPFKLIAPTAYGNICSTADGVGRRAETVLEERHEEAMDLDNIHRVINREPLCDVGDKADWKQAKANGQKWKKRSTETYTDEERKPNETVEEIERLQRELHEDD